ncbi:MULTISPECIES: sensor histidine kinase [unclassified Tolypothrix]|uniref:sensor histidine kinase n=1 Tax=unclassified Tolypothrix TaxID=2649714 RepID=UPI0005EABF8D|nr:MULTISPECIES: ATP-binding protein [unclassified Tolypothrix]BAY92809.1 two-component sensor histidine kinase [Microchaete diplosiphon NIES-3275]EKF04159.1 sensor histidine kinase [Tolypothrix sp. PCC 7601]MBE9088164.1 HAMP domain-containing protein [Tolypothrix sp. LEGE 11397]UYD26727.1 HAMP domain-containing protein [Tolypothrix sp. PCC 7712]UYD37412.1 HAMP domain-containing protein [Tolypothrix sp. PCC 7601]
MQKTINILQKLDPGSLRLRLTAGIAAFSAVGLGSLSVWTSLKMQDILIDNHKRHVEKIADRLPRDVQLYIQMMPQASGLDKSINNLIDNDTFIWIKNPKNQIIATSTNWNQLPAPTTSQLMSLTEMSVKPEVTQVQQRYYVLCGAALQVQNQPLGKLFVVKDITREQTMFLALVRSLGIASLLIIIVISLAIAIYIRRSLQPLRQLSQMAEVISAADLPEAQLSLQQAPSEVKELAQTFNMLLSRLAESWEQERQFVSNVSHELRTPLTIVHGYLQSVLRRPSNLTPTQIEALETAAVEAEHTIRLLQDLLDLARADSGHLHFRMNPCVLNDLVAEVVGMAQKYSDRTIMIEAPNHPIEVKADYNRLKQVLLNLVDNAVKYSEAETPVIVRLHQQDKAAIIQVDDKGYGIPLQHQARIFERFYRIDEARTRSTGGSGLGLSIVKTLIEGMGGSVTVRSRLGKGSIFTISLPISPK